MTDAQTPATPGQLLERADHMRRAGYTLCPRCRGKAALSSENVGPHGPSFLFRCLPCALRIAADYNRAIQEARK